MEFDPYAINILEEDGIPRAHAAIREWDLLAQELREELKQKISAEAVSAFKHEVSRSSSFNPYTGERRVFSIWFGPERVHFYIDQSDPTPLESQYEEARQIERILVQHMDRTEGDTPEIASRYRALMTGKNTLETRLSLTNLYTKEQSGEVDYFGLEIRTVDDMEPYVLTVHGVPVNVEDVKEGRLLRVQVNNISILLNDGVITPDMVATSAYRVVSQAYLDEEFALATGFESSCDADGISFSYSA